jgi:O-antigen/teichoic acid export membrane protein
MSYLQRAIKGAGTTFVLGAIAAGIGYATRIYLARSLTPAEYGLFYAVFTFVLFFLFFRDLGLGQALTKYIAEFRVQGNHGLISTATFTVFSLQFMSSLLFAGVFYFSADWLALHYFKEVQAAVLLQFLVLYIIGSVFIRVSKPILQGFQRMFAYASIEVMKNVLVLLGIVLFFTLGYTLLAPVFAYVLVGPLILLFYFPVLRKRVSATPQITRSMAKKVMVFGLPVMVTAVGGKIIGYIDTLLLTYFTTTTQVGIYNVVLPSAIILLFLGRSVTAILFPMSSELWAKRDTKRLRAGLHLVHKYLFIFLIPLIGIGIVYAELLITTFFGSAYASGTLALQILLVGVLLYAAAMTNNSMLSAIGKPEQVTKIILFAAGLNIVLNLLLIPSFGINGAAVATTVSYFLVFLLSIRKISSYIHATIPWKQWILLLLPASAFLCTLLWFGKLVVLSIWLELVLSIMVGGLVYILLLYLFGLVKWSDVRKFG